MRTITTKDARMLTVDELRTLVGMANLQRETLNDSLDAQGLLDLFWSIKASGYLSWEAWQDDNRRDKSREGDELPNERAPWDALQSAQENTILRRERARGDEGAARALNDPLAYSVGVGIAHVSSHPTVKDPLDGSETPCGCANCLTRLAARSEQDRDSRRAALGTRKL